MIELPDFAGHADALWNALLDLGAVVSSEWVLVGGQMVLLHAIEHGAAWPRVSMDLDVIVNARVNASVRGFVTEIEAIGFVLDGMSPELLAHRYRRGAASIDVLAPEGLGERTDLDAANLLQQLSLRICRERSPTREQLVQHHTQTEDVATAIDPVPLVASLFR